MSSATFLVSGLENGSFFGWDLNLDATPEMKVHLNGVTTLEKHEGFLISGDRKG